MEEDMRGKGKRRREEEKKLNGEKMKEEGTKKERKMREQERRGKGKEYNGMEWNGEKKRKRREKKAKEKRKDNLLNFAMSFCNVIQQTTVANLFKKTKHVKLTYQLQLIIRNILQRTKRQPCNPTNTYHELLLTSGN